MFQVKQSSTDYPVVFNMMDSTDPLVGKTGLSPTLTVSKNGGAFAAATGAAVEISGGQYSWTPNATDRNTLGRLVLRATATGAVSIDTLVTVLPYDVFDVIDANLSEVAGTSVSGVDDFKATGFSTHSANDAGEAAAMVAQAINTDAPTVGPAYTPPTNTWIDGPGRITSASTPQSLTRYTNRRYRDSNAVLMAGTLDKIYVIAAQSTAASCRVTVYRGGGATPTAKVWAGEITPTLLTTWTIELDFDGLGVEVEAGDHLSFEWYGGTSSTSSRFYCDSVSGLTGIYYDTGFDANGDHTDGDWTSNAAFDDYTFSWVAHIKTDEAIVFTDSSPSGTIDVPMRLDGVCHYLFEDVKVAPGDSLSFTFQKHHPTTHSSWVPLDENTTGNDAVLTLDLGATDQMTFFGDSVALENVTVSLDASEPTGTTWNADGTVMSNASAGWDSGVDKQQVREGYKIRVTAGTNVVLGDYRVQTIDSDSQMTLETGISDGGLPSSVTYTIVRDEANDDFDLLVWFDIVSETANVIWMNKNTGQGGQYWGGAFDVTWRSHAVANDGATPKTRRKCYGLDAGRESGQDHACNKIVISGTGTVGSLIVLVEPVFVPTDSYAGSTIREVGGVEISGIASYIGALMPVTHKVLPCAVPGSSLSTLTTAQTSIAARFGLVPSTLDASTREWDDDVSIAGLHDLCEVPEAIFFFANGPSINDALQFDTELLTEQITSEMISRLAHMIGGFYQRKAFNASPTSEVVVGYGQQFILSEMVYEPNDSTAKELIHNNGIDSFNLALQTLASMNGVSLARINRVISSREISGVDGGDGLTYYAGFRADYRVGPTTYKSVHLHEDGYLKLAELLVLSYTLGAYAFGNASVGSKQDEAIAITNLIQAKTDNLPASPAAVGSEMDLVDAPNATAITTIQDGLALATALQAVDDIVDAVKAKTDKLTFTGDDLHTTIQNIVAVALAKFVTTNTGETSAVTGSVAKISQGAGGGGSVVVGPIQVVSTPLNLLGSPIPLQCFRNEAKDYSLTVVDADGDAVDLSGMSLKFVAHTASNTPTGIFEVLSGSIAISGANNEIATISTTATNNDQTPETYSYELWDTTGADVVGHGPYEIATSLTTVA